MRAINKPTYDPEAVYKMCINSIEDEDLRDRLHDITSDIVNAANDYDQKALNKQLYTILVNNCNVNDIVLGDVTKKELKNVYTSHMVPKNKPARNIYDTLVSLAPSGRCPFCGFGHVYTLDHYLPKAKYPQFSVLPFNLVPSCTDCNKGKSTAIATTQEGQSLHPYYDQGNFINDQWLYAEVKRTSPVTIQFYVKPPIHWSAIEKARVESHFKDFNLSSRYVTETVDELAILKDILIQYEALLGQTGVSQHLLIQAQSHAMKHANSWQTAMYQALSASNWYCGGGFK